MLSEVSAHPDYTEIGRDEYMDAWDGGNPLFDLQCETDEPGGCRAFVNLVEDDEFVADISGLVSGTNLSIHYRITPAEDIEASLEALEQVGFEHHRTDPPDPDETAFEQVFTAIEETSQKTAGDSCEPSRETEQTVFDGRYQCGECGTMRQIRTFAGVARPPAEIGTDCPDCDGERQFDAITPDADSVVHRWVLEFEDVLREPYRLTLKAPSRTHARRTAQAAHLDRSIELVLHEERL